jgi:hypothetical protein
MSLLCARAEVDDAQQRIARRFDPHELRLLRERLRERGIVGLIDEQHAQRTALGERIEQPVGAAVAVVRRNQQIAGIEELTDELNRGHA